MSSGSSFFDPKLVAEETEWLLRHPHFDEKPASIREFLSKGYLELDGMVRPGLQKALEDIFGDEVNGERIALYEEAMVTGGIGIGKQLNPDENILTPTGWIQIQHLNIGDLVIGSDGKGHRVTNITRWEDIERYKITFKDGTSIECGAEHLWTVNKRGFKRVHGKHTRVVRQETLSTEELSTRKLKTADLWNYSIPLVAPVEYDIHVEQEIDPYILGLLIANGAFTKGTPSIAGHDDDLAWIQLQVAATTPGLRAVNADRRIRISGVSGVENWVQTALKRIGLFGVTSQHKFIPDDYKFGSPFQRLELLRGLMDGDGSQAENNGSTFSTSSNLLAYDVADLVRSLGGYCTVIEFDRNDTTEYQVHINLDQTCPFKNPRKASKWKPRTNQKPNRAIVAVEKIENGPGVCISIDAPDKLYVTKDFILTHNTTFASIALPYMAHWVLCLKDPQGFFNLMPGSRIAFMQMSTSEKQALEVVFGDIFARIKHSPWFVNNYPHDDKYTKQIRFPKDIWILPGDSAETTFEGYNILAGILDEMDSHKLTRDKDYADVGFDTIQSRIASRFVVTDDDGEEVGHKGLIICIGQMKKGNGFAARKYKEMKANPKAHVTRMTIWESFGWQKFLNKDGTRNSFWYDTKRKQIIPTLAVEHIKNENLVEIPMAYKRQFDNNPEKALRDLAGIPPATSDAFISLVDKIEACRDRWIDRYESDESPVDDNPTRPQFKDWFRAENDPRRRVIHVDLATSGDGDALGFAMGYVDAVTEIDGEQKPHIVIDCLLRIRAMPGQEIFLSDVRKLIYELKYERNFRVVTVTMDGFQSTDTLQQLRKKRFKAEYLSVDKNTLPYEDLRDAIYEDRLDFPPYLTYLKKGDTNLVDIAVQEIMTLQDTGKKIDHPPDGSKDVADALAGVVTTLMGDRKYRRGVRSTSAPSDEPDELAPTGTTDMMGRVLPFPGRGDGLRAPVPPTTGGTLGLTIPRRLQPRRER